MDKKLADRGDSAGPAIGGFLRDFLTLVDSARTVPELTTRTLEVIQHFGLCGAASEVITGSRATTPQRFHFASWPTPFLTQYVREDLQATDPISRWARATGTPATFSHIEARLTPKDPGRKVMRVARQCGLIEGICVPLRTACGAVGLISVAGNRPRFKPEEFRDLVAIASLVFRTAERLAGPGVDPQGSPLLTTREIEMLPLLVHGHSDQEIASLSGISEATVRFHLKNVRRKMGAVSRTHLAAKAVTLGFVSL